MKPEVGQGATIMYPKDRKPACIVAVTANTVTLEYLRIVSGWTGHRPAGYIFGLPVWDYVYTEQELQTFRTGHTIKAHLHKDGRWFLRGGVPVELGEARYYRDYSD